MGATSGPEVRGYWTVRELADRTDQMPTVVLRHIQNGWLPAVDVQAEGLVDPAHAGESYGRLRHGILCPVAALWIARYSRRLEDLLPRGVEDCWVPVTDVGAAVGQWPSTAYHAGAMNRARAIEFPGRGQMAALPLSVILAWWKGPQKGKVRQGLSRSVLEPVPPFPFEKLRLPSYPKVETLGHEPTYRLGTRERNAWRVLEDAGLLRRVAVDGGGRARAREDVAEYRAVLGREERKALGLVDGPS